MSLIASTMLELLLSFVLPVPFPSVFCCEEHGVIWAEKSKEVMLTVLMGLR